MKKVEFNEIREKLDKYLAEAEQGEEIIILRHSKPVARPVAYKERKPEFPGMTTFRKQYKVKGNPLSEIVTDMRNKERY